MYKKILVPVDLNENGFADRALELAIWHAKQSGAELHLVTVLPGIHSSMVASYFPKDAALQMKQDVKMQLTQFAQKHINQQVAYQIHVAEGKAYKIIVKHAQSLKADLIIMPSHKRSKLNKTLLGSVTSKVVESSPINVLVVKPQG